MAHIPSFEEFTQGAQLEVQEKLTEGFKSKSSGTFGGALLAGGLNAYQLDGPEDDDKYGFNKTE